MKEDLLQVFRSNQNYFIWIEFGLFGTEIHKTKVLTHVQDSRQKSCFYDLDLTSKGVRLHRI